MNDVGNILVIDDDPVSNFMVERLFKKLSITERVKLCRNGKDGLKFICENPENLPSLILVDINMPVMDGVEFLQAFHKLILPVEKIKIIFISASSLEKKNAELLKDYDILLKPITAEKIKKILKTEAVF